MTIKTEIYEDNAGNIHAIVKHNDEVVNIIDGLERWNFDVFRKDIYSGFPDADICDDLQQRYSEMLEEMLPVKSDGYNSISTREPGLILIGEITSVCETYIEDMCNAGREFFGIYII